MQLKPDAKPVVLGWLNPLANGCLTLKQNKTKQNKAGFGSSNQNQNPPYLLSVNLTSKVISLASSLCEAVATARHEGSMTCLSTGFQQGFPQSPEGVS